MVDIKIKRGTPVFRPGISEEEKAEALRAMEEYFVGFEQQMVGQGRTDAIDKFIELLKNLSPERLEKLEEQIKSLHGMEKFQRFRLHFFLLLLDVFQGGMHFALDKRAMDNHLDLLKVLKIRSDKSPTE
jgi:hypothetical protein